MSSLISQVIFDMFPTVMCSLYIVDTIPAPYSCAAEVIFAMIVTSEESPEDKRWRRQFVFYTVDGALHVVARRQSPQVAQTHDIGVSTAGTPCQLNGGRADVRDRSCGPVTIDWTRGDSVVTTAHLQVTN